MGRGFIKYEFPDSGREPDFVLFSAHLNNRLPDGERLHIRQAAAWCQPVTVLRWRNSSNLLQSEKLNFQSWSPGKINSWRNLNGSHR